ncbi:unnamed protein product [Rotaria socialis]|uniref:EGF-like domain-containing protein n=1 Tax=Rotaria socialis TaxID=392032 RepID=A0A820URG6_9BILA|nr:unnamed protein product [Rotaria socialis]
MVDFRWLAISNIFLILLFKTTDAFQNETDRQIQIDQCLSPAVDICDFIKCENGGNCMKDLTTTDCYKCICVPGFTGNICDTTITILPNECDPGCQNGGTCIDNRCECNASFTGTYCESRDYCSPTNPCQNGGRCTSSSSSFMCDCTGTGYTGSTCGYLITIDPCASNPCQNGGKCSSNGVTTNCSCIDGYYGAYCQISSNPCPETACENGGRCEWVAANTYRCVCPAEFTGVRCETFVLANHPCITMPSIVCKNGGVCTINGPDYLCKCAMGWSGTNCQEKVSNDTCDPSPCGTYGTCFLVNLPQGLIPYCACNDRWTGKYCDVNMDGKCTNEYCFSGGTCRMNGNITYCDCTAMYTGQRCESLIDTSTTTTTATATTTTATETATTAATTTTTTTMSSSTETPEFCSPNPCQNGGTCLSTSNTFLCLCELPWSGAICTTYELITNFTSTTTAVTTTTILTTVTVSNVPTACASQPCKNGGTCVPIGSSYSCFCGTTSIYTGKNCDSTAPMPIDECPLNCTPGRCIFSGNAIKPYACLWNGVMRPADVAVLLTTLTNAYDSLSAVRIENGCPNPGVRMCQYVTCANGGECQETDTPRCFTCNCRVGFVGETCETKQEIKNTTNLCEFQPCQHGGSCYPINNNDFVCQCSPSTTGRYCEQIVKKNSCDSRPCLNGGTCIIKNNTFECICPSQNTGHQCEINQLTSDVCSTTTCFNGGICHASGNRTYCYCSSGTTGRYCEDTLPLNPCLSSPCYSGGTCIPSNDTFKCLCSTYNTGKFCENFSSSHPCASAPCLNNAHCFGVNHNTDFYCYCGYDRAGRFCEIEMTYKPCQYSPCRNGGSCISMNDTFRCECPPRTTGYYCELSEELDLCSLSPCLNGGTCYKISQDQIECRCPSNTNGYYCEEVSEEFNLCYNQPCMNGGTCIASNGSFRCICPPYKTGHLCQANQTVTNACRSSPCLNSGTCLQLNDSYTCLCTSNFSGSNCERINESQECKLDCRPGVCIPTNNVQNPYACLCNGTLNFNNCSGN